MMKIRFSLALDGARSTLPALGPGDVVMGPQGLLNLLELHLGLQPVIATPAQRAVDYRLALTQVLAGHPDAFYAASLAVDELGVAARLLQWRDDWHLHGWQGQPGPDWTGRLLDMARVEALFNGRSAPSVGERLAAVAQALEGRAVPVTDLACLQPRESLPRCWQQVLDRLPARYPPPDPSAEDGSMLARLQAALLDPSAHGPIDWSDDGSLTLVESAPGLLAHAWLSARRGDQGDTLLLAEHDAQWLDDGLRRAGHPAHGLADASRLRPALQVLPLALSLLWQPPDIYAVVSFLTHPLCPIPGFVRMPMARHIARRPGVEPDQLLRELNSIQAAWQEQHADEADSGARIQSAIGQAQGWLIRDRFAPNPGAPIEAVRQVVVDLAEYFRKRSGAAQRDGREDTGEGAAHAQCVALLQSLGQLLAQGEQALTPRPLQTLVRHASARGAVPPGRFPEWGASRVATSPAQVVEPVDELIWWNLRGAPAIPRSVFTRAERQALRDAGIALPDPARQLADLQREQLLPVLHARRRLVLVVPRRADEETHPLIQWVRHRVRGVPTLRMTDLLDAPIVAFGGVSLASRPLKTRPLPAVRRWWTLPPGVVPDVRVDEDSFSSMNLYLGAPHQWVLRYGARLEPSGLLDLPQGPLLWGTLAHGVIERLFQAQPTALDMDLDEVSERARALFEERVRAEGATLLADGRGNELRRVAGIVTRSAVALCRSLKAAGVREVRPELSLRGHFAGEQVKLRGSADLVVERADGSSAIVDMKWGGAAGKARQLEQGQHLQLVLYGGLLGREADAPWPELAYFILSGQKLLAQDRAFFADAEASPPKAPLTSLQIWGAAERSWLWRRQLLREGRIEVVTDGTAGDAWQDQHGVPPDGGYVPETPRGEYDDYRSLTGWGGDVSDE